MEGKPVEVIFFDIRDTLGEVDRPGHLVVYQPSTQALLAAMREAVGLRIGVITNLPRELTAEQGRRMIEEAGITPYLDPNGIIISHEVGLEKPNPEIFRLAARQMGVAPEQCVFVGENLIECLGARAAGMQAQLKPCPPGREFLPPPVERRPVTPTDSGRAFEAFFEHEHLLGDRIFSCGAAIVERLKGLGPDDPLPDDVRTAMGMLIYLTNNFADQAHLQAEEAVIPLAISRGMDPSHASWVYDHHAQGRAYFRAMDIAWRRLEAGELRAKADFALCTEGFVNLFRIHAELENDRLYPEVGRYFNDSDDSLIMNLVTQIGPRDFTPYVGIVEAMERALGIGG